MAARDREGLRRAVEVLRSKSEGSIFLGGHSYGGRQGSMLVAEQPQLVAGLLLLSYPLHPPRKPLELRTGHFSQLSTPSLFVHGGRDPFGSQEEMNAAMALIPGQKMLLEIEGAGHELLGKKANEDLQVKIVQAFQEFFTKA
jgi:predicted alpha/beta-hydrolase family hydrolase